MSKVIAVIGATGAQGLPVLKHLLEARADGTPSPWKVRALTRDPDHERAQDLKRMGVELVKGSFIEPKAVHQLFDGAYGAYVNTDSFTVGSATEMASAFMIWEIAQYQKVRHYIWSNLDYVLRLGNYDPTYTCDHSNSKGRFGDFLMQQKNALDAADGTMWTVFTTGPYMDMLSRLFAPIRIRDDGTREFKSPMGTGGSIPLIALDDLGWWVRYIFDNPSTTTGKNLEVASHPTTFPEIVETFKEVTGLPAEYQPVSMDEYFSMFNGDEIPVASEEPEGKTWEDNFRAWWAMYRDSIIKRDMNWVKSIHQPTTLAQWMKDNDYKGEMSADLLKNDSDGKNKLRPRLT